MKVRASVKKICEVGVFVTHKLFKGDLTRVFNYAIPIFFEYWLVVEIKEVFGHCVGESMLTS